VLSSFSSAQVKQGRAAAALEKQAVPDPTKTEMGIETVNEMISQNLVECLIMSVLLLQ
jgi:hypothetical protein